MRLFISVLLLVSVGLTHAQTTVTCFSSADSVYNSIKELEEIVVTAEKRELNPKDIPAALTVITPRNIPGENNPDLRNLSGIVPNFYMQEGGLKLSTPIYIRGIGTVSGTPPVGLYVDGIPVFDKNAFVFDLYDIRQIEILRGPQTTLYGRNSINGLIHISTNPPKQAFFLTGKSGICKLQCPELQSDSPFALAKLPAEIFFCLQQSRRLFPEPLRQQPEIQSFRLVQPTLPGKPVHR